MSAYFIVRAEVGEADREAFDRWYETEHLPDAKQAFGIASAWRGWSDVTPGVHIAFYEFADLAAVRAMTQSDALKRMIAEFDRNWGDRVPRSREVIDICQTV